MEYLGGSGSDYLTGVAIDKSNDIFVTGYTNSPDFYTKDAYQSGLFGSNNAFLTKYNSEGVLQFSTTFGDSSSTISNGLTIDSHGNVWITGGTDSSNLPIKNGNKTVGANEDVFIAEFDTNGVLLYSTYYGAGGLNDQANAIAIDSTDSYLITGRTASSDLLLKNANQSTYGGGAYDAFVAKFDSSHNLVYASLLGGNNVDEAYKIVTDSSNNAYITGYTRASNFPVINAINSTQVGGADVFITKFSPTGSILFSTYFGGSLDDFGNALTVDNVGNFYIVGQTLSTDFPVHDALYATAGGATYYDGFVFKLSSDGQNLGFSSLFNGTKDDYSYALAIDANANLFITGRSWSSNYPINNAYYPFLTGSDDVVITSLIGPKGLISGVAPDQQTSSNIGNTSPSSSNFLNTDLLKYQTFDLILGLAVLSILVNFLLLIRKRK